MQTRESELNPSLTWVQVAVRTCLQTVVWVYYRNDEWKVGNVMEGPNVMVQYQQRLSEVKSTLLAEGNSEVEQLLH